MLYIYMYLLCMKGYQVYSKVREQENINIAILLFYEDYRNCEN